MAPVQQPSPLSLSCHQKSRRWLDRLTSRQHWPRSPGGLPGWRATPGGHTEHPLPAGPVPSRRGRSSSQTKGPRRKKPIFRFIEGGEGAGEGAIKSFCFIYKERHFQEALLKEERAASSPTTSSSKAKPRRGEGNRRGQGTPNTPLRQKPRAFSPHPQCVYPRDPSGRRKGVCTQWGWHWAGGGRE